MSVVANIAIAGFQHETNTFAPHKATYADFVKADGWPGLTSGAGIFSTMHGLNIPISGFIASAESAGHKLYPVLWASAEPSSYVTEQAFETIVDMICSSLGAMDNIDAVYLDLHGAMVTEHRQDGEGELLRRVRNIIGPDKPLIISLDLHANITSKMMLHVNAMTIFRTYPHLDMAETGGRAFELMQAMLDGARFESAMRKIPFLFPLTSQCTDFEPCKSIYQKLPVLTTTLSGSGNVDFATGFPPADIAECGAAIVAYGENKEEVNKAIDRLYQQIVDAEQQFVDQLYQADEAVIKAMKIAADKPVILADAQDNPGAGGTSDTTGLLQALVENQAQGAVLGVMYDPEIAALAHQLGEAAWFDASLGGKSGFSGSKPYQGRFIVESLGDGNFTFTGDMYKNSAAQLGLMALLKIDNDKAGVQVIVSSERVQCLDLAIFRHLGVDPMTQKILAVKSSVHFRADFDPIASEILVVASPGANYCELGELKYYKLRQGVRLGPLGPVQL
ncbi:MAG: M81 family metallopeptidase [Gammaproteobacteria bacterium]|nr:M81 family metallopeptidase [Gammaproteobacteria bacterium]